MFSKVADSTAFDPLGVSGQYAIEALQSVNFLLSGIVQTQGAGSVWQQAKTYHYPYPYAYPYPYP